jgi:hypothetical protein
MEVKVFFSNDPAKLETQIQQWLDLQQDISIKAVTQCQGKNASAGEEGVIVTLFYT